LAEAMTAAGYRSFAAVNQVHLQARFGFAQGFETYLQFRGMGAPKLNLPFLRWLDGKDTEPFFAYLHYLDVHWPYTRFPDGRPPASFGRAALPERPPHDASKADAWAEGVGEAEIQALRARYDAEIAWIDAAVGELLDDLERRGLLEDTLVVVTSDHGEAFREHGRIQHGWEPYRELTHVPLILRPPVDWEPFHRVEEIVGLVDVMPTVLDLVGAEIPDACQGRSLAAALRGEPLLPRVHYADGAQATAARTRDRMLMSFEDGGYELFDTERDPDELAAVAWACTDTCERLLRGAETYRTRLQRKVRAKGRVLEALTAEDLAELRALGYL
jgi:arylsulfatase A-like enzyme